MGGTLQNIDINTITLCLRILVKQFILVYVLTHTKINNTTVNTSKETIRLMPDMTSVMRLISAEQHVISPHLGGGGVLDLLVGAMLLRTNDVGVPFLVPIMPSDSAVKLICLLANRSPLIVLQTW